MESEDRVEGLSDECWVNGLDSFYQACDSGAWALDLDIIDEQPGIGGAGVAEADFPRAFGESGFDLREAPDFWGTFCFFNFFPASGRFCFDDKFERPAFRPAFRVKGKLDVRACWGVECESDG